MGMDLSNIDSVLTLVLVTAYVVLACVSAFQLLRIIYYRHPIKSFQAWFLIICLFWCTLRAIFFLKGQDMPDAAFTLVYWLPIDLQFMTFSLLVIFYAFLLHQATWEARRHLYFGVYGVVNASVVIITCVYVAIACRSGDECVFDERLTRLHHVFMASQFTVLVFVYGFYGWRLWRTSGDAAALFPSQSVPCSVTFLTLGAWVVFCSRWIYNILVSIDQKRFAISLMYGDDGMIDVAPRAFFLLVWWEVVPSLFVLSFFRTIPPTPNGLCPEAFPCLNPPNVAAAGYTGPSLNAVSDDPFLLLDDHDGLSPGPLHHASHASGGAGAAHGYLRAGGPGAGAGAGSAGPPSKRGISILARWLPGCCFTAPCLGAVGRFVCCIPPGYADALRMHRRFAAHHGHDGSDSAGDSGSGAGGRGRSGSRGARESVVRGVPYSDLDGGPLAGHGGTGGGDAYSYGQGLYFDYSGYGGGGGDGGGGGAGAGSGAFGHQGMFAGGAGYGGHGGYVGNGYTGNGFGGFGGEGIYATGAANGVVPVSAVGNGVYDGGATGAGAGVAAVGASGAVSPQRRVYHQQYQSPFYDGDGFIGYGYGAGSGDGDGGGVSGVGVSGAFGGVETGAAQVHYGTRPNGAGAGRSGDRYQHYKY